MHGKTRVGYLLTLLIRGAAFLTLVIYGVKRPAAFQDSLHQPWKWSPVTVVWLALMISMLLRLRPSRWESLGCQKIYAARYRPTGIQPSMEEIRQADRGAWKVLAVWSAVNALILSRAGERFLVCLAGFYGVCDMICILFYCPFQHWLMGNRCCIVCRIFDWDYLMMCTPLIGVRGWRAVSAWILAAVVFLRWESVFRRHPERFLESGNAALRCADCQEQLCRYRRKRFCEKSKNHS